MAGGVHGRGNAWWGACVTGGMHGRGVHGSGACMAGTCMAGSMHGRGCLIMINTLLLEIITIHKRSMWRLCFYTCLSFCPQQGGCLPQCMLGYTPSPGRNPPGRHPLGQIPPWEDTPGQSSAWEDTPWETCWDTQCPVHAGINMATAVDGTHPTGMHSCLWLNLGELYPVESLPAKVVPQFTLDVSWGRHLGSQISNSAHGWNPLPVGKSEYQSHP